VSLQRRGKVWQAVALALAAADLMIASWGFNPASDPALLDYTPSAIAWLREQPGDWRYISIDEPNLGERGKILNANMTWRYGLDDVRGYESIIPKQYVEFMKLLAPQVQLDFNRVAPLYPDYQYEAMGREERLDTILRSPLLALLNVRYAVSSTQFTLPDSLSALWSLAYEDDAVRVWELRETLPRVYGVTDAEIDALTIPTESIGTFTITHDSGREKLIDAEVTQPGWLVVSETHLPGWRAFIRPQGAGEDAEQAVEVQLVRGNFQGVRLSEAGTWTIRLSYSPTSFQLGAFGSFIGVVLLLFTGGVYLWRLFVAQSSSESGVQVVARNSIAPIILNLFNRGIDFAFAFVMLRILGPEGSGIYYYAAFIFGWFDIFTNFGLNVFLTREVSRDRSQAWRLLLNTSTLRLLLMIVGAGLLAAFLGARQSLVAPPLVGEALLAIALLYIGLLPNSLSTGLSALFYAFEKAEYPAAVTTVATISKAVFGVAALALGYGVVGLAAVSILTNLVTLAVLAWSARGLLTITRARPDRRLMRGMIGEGLPLMINHFLATIFFQVDVVIIEAIHGARMVGQYSVAYKWVSALNVIPAFFTMALLPGMSRLAREDRPALLRTYRLAIKLLVSVALPVAVVFTALAYPLTGL
ncbi:MAG: flippase, partial [Anaerolineae bacterium]|nr:flippase [Anaerolineae bacterium]